MPRAAQPGQPPTYRWAALPKCRSGTQNISAELRRAIIGRDAQNEAHLRCRSSTRECGRSGVGLGLGGNVDHAGEHRLESGLVGADEAFGRRRLGQRVDEDVEHGAWGGREVAAAHHGRLDRPQPGSRAPKQSELNRIPVRSSTKPVVMGLS